MHTYHVKQDANLSRGGRREECQQAYSQKNTAYYDTCT